MADHLCWFEVIKLVLALTFCDVFGAYIVQIAEQRAEFGLSVKKILAALPLTKCRKVVMAYAAMRTDR